MGLPNGFRLVRVLATVLATFVFSLLYNACAPGYFGRGQHRTAPLRRPDFSSYLGLSLAATFLACALFTFIYCSPGGQKNLRTACFTVLCRPLLAVMVDFNAYILYPLPFSLVWKWPYSCCGV
jgi:amino acid transporter